MITVTGLRNLDAASEESHKGRARLAAAGGPATLRVSVTDRCNLRCAYCLPPAGVLVDTRDPPLGLDELARLVSWIAGKLPLEKIKITGGEPMVRRGLEHLIQILASLPDPPEVSMTTNGTLLAGSARDLREAGLVRVNVSLDTLDPRRYWRLTRGGRVQRVLDGLAAAREAGLAPIKINAVLRRSGWRKDVPALLDFASTHGFELRFLELMRTGPQSAWCEREFVGADQVIGWLTRQHGCSVMHAPELTVYESAPARPGLLRWRGRELKVGWILPVTRPFCGACNRLRLDAHGRVRRCLMDPTAFPLAKSLATLGDAATCHAMAHYLAGKRAPAAMLTDVFMASLGG